MVEYIIYYLDEGVGVEYITYYLDEFHIASILVDKGHFSASAVCLPVSIVPPMLYALSLSK